MSMTASQSMIWFIFKSGCRCDFHLPCSMKFSWTLRTAPEGSDSTAPSIFGSIGEEHAHLVGYHSLCLIELAVRTAIRSYSTMLLNEKGAHLAHRSPGDGPPAERWLLLPVLGRPPLARRVDHAKKYCISIVFRAFLTLKQALDQVFLSHSAILTCNCTPRAPATPRWAESG